MGRQAVFLDRDGVLNYTEVRNGKLYAPRSLEAFELMPDAFSATEALHRAGLLLIVVTNQPDVGNGFVPRSTVEAMHDRLRTSLPIDAIKVCFHGQAENCPCRKPRPGMLLEASQEMNIELKKSFMVGDRPDDVAVGRLQGCYTIFIDRGYSEHLRELPDATVTSLSEAVELILSRVQNAGTEETK
jgi:D-glycero-D-manno-heptose 1,7-bisphosphate phosphatase